MGNVNFGIPKKITLFLKNLAKIDEFVETGTYQGNTSIWASNNFSKVFTIENSDYYYNLSKEKFKDIKNIKIIKGHTIKVLPEIFEKNNSKKIFWLDAHWSGGETYGSNDECPLIDELKLIKKYSKESIILIDDARLFVCPPPKPHNFKKWPTIQEIVSTIGKDYYLSIINDVIIICPKKFENNFKEFIQSNSCFCDLPKNNKCSLIFKKIFSGVKK
jgi:hypothetical protein